MGRTQRERVGSDSITVPGQVDSEGRTVEWIAHSPFPEHSQAESADNGGTGSAPLVSQSDPERMSEDQTGDQSIASDSRPVTSTDVSTAVASNMDGQTISCDIDGLTQPETDGQTVVTQKDKANDMNNVDTVASVSQSENPSTSTQVRSRFGRILKPVDRLIQTMSRQDIVHTHPSMQAICRSVFQVFHD